TVIQPKSCTCDSTRIFVLRHHTKRRCDTDCFFSGRRRHTRSKRDWSSDVCSSDLDFPQPDFPQITRNSPFSTVKSRCRSAGCCRSEERRVEKARATENETGERKKREIEQNEPS